MSFIKRLFNPTIQSYKFLYKRNGVTHGELKLSYGNIYIMFLLPWLEGIIRFIALWLPLISPCKVLHNIL